MSPEEIAAIWYELSVERQQLLTDFARFLLDKEHDDRWEAIVTDPLPRPHLDAFLRESAREDLSGRMFP